jgi:DNA-binding protein HU-beta
VNKSELIAAVAEKTGEPKTKEQDILDAAVATAQVQLKLGDDVVFGNLGKLSAAKREAREARNPSTGATIQVPAKTVVKFKPAKALADAVA